jgi:chlorophyll synthase
MTRVALRKPFDSSPDLLAALELLKPITWFPPMWAFGCGIASVAGSASLDWWRVALGVLLTGPIVCGCSQAVNDWFDRDVDAINEPNRPIPSGRVPGYWGLIIAIVWTALGVVAALPLGVFAFRATLAGLLLAWAYSAPPVRLKRNGWYGNTAVAVCYEGLPWVTAAAVAGGGIVSTHVLVLAALYSAGAHGIMTLNDFKSVDGDKRMGVRSLPVQLGVPAAARLACVTMALPQVIVLACLVHWHAPWFAIAVGALLIAQLLLMRRLLQQPRERAPWYNGTGITLYVLGMLVSAFALRMVPA